MCFIPLRPRFPYGLTFAHSAFAVSRTFQGRNPNGRRGSAVSTMLTVDFNTEVLSSYRFYEPRYMVLCLLVEIHFQGSLTVTNACVDREPTEVRGGRGSDSAQGVLLPLALHIVKSRLTVTYLGLADILHPVYERI